MREFKIGDIVKVKDYGYIYSSYSQMFKKFNFKNTISNYPLKDTKNTNYKVIGMTRHEWSNVPLLAIESTYNQLIIAAHACKLIFINNNIQIL